MVGFPTGSLSTIRVRLIAALAAALLPVLVLGALQSAIGFQREGRELRQNLGFAAERSAATARARMESADILLQTLAPGAIGFQCQKRLEQVTTRIPGYLNLIRFDRQGRVVCAAGGVPADLGRAERPWFRQLSEGGAFAITRDPGSAYAEEPAILTSARAQASDGTFDGAFAAVIALSSLQPQVNDPSLPKGAEVGLVEKTGRYITYTDAGAFPRLPTDWRAKVEARGSLVWYGKDGKGRRRVYSAAPVIGDEVYVVLSAQSPGILSWARLNPLTGIAFPLLTFLLALITVSVVADRVVVRWIVYLQRIAALYARGRLSVRPVQAEQMPPEIRELAETLEDMADAIVGRDASLRDSLAQKDSLMREIHHRVKNNLQVISSLLNMQQRALTDPAARSAMSDTRQRITALALIYRALYQGPDLKRVDLRPFLEELTAQLVNGELMQGHTVRTELKVDPLVIDPDRLAPLALFAVEAITNAQKHAFRARGGVLRLNFTVNGEEAVLEICDDGQVEEGDLMSSGVGRTLMTAFARQLRGRAELFRNEAGGVTARLIFPTPAADRAPPAVGNQAAA
ncbi:MAG: sensor histidine kinase [Alphaproteobacteria bacterium]|nr:sensor histidine kinase [Alphaproteobacteria bacterium]MBU1517268.1 sensor histidine kinase [Alphaproteobacteria bacterium]MBU2093196.1 sensor histidine kinase [Alphaproteobacteria bacterium]MBU2154233.1 sensor histidine kinase [Alphaproteobacteria bacterium]MBU2305864.1 sensor histidine kinase [Alphaproteobacteria bacterium]